MAVASYSFRYDGQQMTVAGTTLFDPLPPADKPFGLFVTLTQLVMVSLLSDARAAAGDTLPDTSGDPVDRGGWWGDTYSGEVGSAGIDGDRWGSLLWLHRRSRVRVETAQQVRSRVESALAWLVSDGLAERVDVETQRVEVASGRPYIAIGVDVVQGESTRYAGLWA